MNSNNEARNSKLLLTEPEACDVLGLSRSTLRRLWAQGAIKPVKVGRALRFPASEIRRFVSQLETEAEIGISEE